MGHLIPRVTVGIPVFNGERYLGEAIESTLSQTFTDLELVICDNASSDATEEICRRYARLDSRVRYVRNRQNIGANANFNRVVQLSNHASTYFRWAAHDDLCAPTYLEQCVRMLDEDTMAVLCHSQTRLIDRRGRELSPDGPMVGGHKLAPRDPVRRLNSKSPPERFADVLLQTRWCFEIFGVMRLAALNQTGMQGNYYGADKVILATLALIGPFLEVPAELFLRRCHSEQSTNIRSAANRAAWSDPKVRRAPLVAQLPCLRGYIRAASTACLFPIERAACRCVIARYMMQGHKFASLMLESLGLERPWDGTVKLDARHGTVGNAQCRTGAPVAASVRA